MPAAIICTVDVVLLTLGEGGLQVALLRRDHEPFAGVLALPGGYIHPDEDRDAEDAAARVLRAKAGIASPYLEQLGTFAGPTRDPRGWSVSIAYYALVPPAVVEAAAPSGMQRMPADRMKGLPFDHAEIVRAALQRLRGKSLYSSLPVHLCGEQFTIPQLQAVYEAVLGEPVNKVSFRRKLDELDVIEPIPGAYESGRQNRPAQLYRLQRKHRGRITVVDRGLNSG
jgi:8-oxo-dGTP diphosphatase